MKICINVKVFEWTILLSSATHMATQITYLGRMEVGEWYYIDYFIDIFNRISSFWTGTF